VRTDTLAVLDGADTSHTNKTAARDTSEEQDMDRTRPPGRRRGRQRTRAAAIALGWACFAAFGCGGGAATAPPEFGAAETPPAGTLRFRLVFDDSADLDLYVTGPLLETVYYGNTPSRIGGSLAADVRCDAPADPRTETVEFPDAPPGRYRVGVDFPERCRLATAPEAFRIAIDGDGVHHERSGEIRLGAFVVTVFEFDYSPKR